MRDLPFLLLFSHLLDSAEADAVRGYSPAGEPTELSRNAMEWMTERGLRVQPSISFDVCCLALGLEAEQERRRRLAEIWQARRQLQGQNRSPNGRWIPGRGEVMTRRLRAYGIQTRQVRRPITNLPQDRPGGFILAG